MARSRTFRRFIPRTWEERERVARTIREVVQIVSLMVTLLTACGVLP
jgi:hypothetical protein